MTKEGQKVLPNLKKKFKISNKIKKLLNNDKQLYNNFYNFPKLYQTIRLDAIQRYELINKTTYKKALNNFIKQTRLNKMYGM